MTNDFLDYANKQEENEKNDLFAPTKGDKIVKYSSIFSGITLIITILFVFQIVDALVLDKGFGSGKPVIILLLFGSLFAIPSISISSLALIFKTKFHKVQAVIGIVVGIIFFVTIGIFQIVL